MLPRGTRRVGCTVEVTAWLGLGFCTVLLVPGIGRIDRSMDEAARLEGADFFARFRAVTLPGLKSEIGVCVAVPPAEQQAGPDPGVVGIFMPFAVFWMRAHFLSVPRELAEASQID